MSTSRLYSGGPQHKDALCHNHVQMYTSYLCVYLSPSLYTCRDYEKHLKELDRKFQTEQSTISERVGMRSEVDIITRSDSSVTGVYCCEEDNLKLLASVADVKTFSQSFSESAGEAGGGGIGGDSGEEGGGGGTEGKVMEEEATQKKPAADEVGVPITHVFQ